MPSCKHDLLRVEPSSHAQKAGYTRRTLQQRVAATRPSGRATKAAVEDAASEHLAFPGPLVLPGDDLAWDPKYDAQSVRSWLQLPERNRVTPDKRTVYVVPAPSIAAEIKHVQDWIQPKIKSQTNAKTKLSSIPRPRHEDVVEYVAAFYHNVPVKLLAESKLRFEAWDDGRPTKKRSKGAHIALNIGSESVRVRTRPSLDGVFDGQLSLDDLLDGAISLLPKDAYALLLLVDHDLYEDEEDMFCCGRAYGGSRVAVVSTARYNPTLDTDQEVELEHAWPASHCQEYIDTCLKGSTSDSPPAKKRLRP